MFKTPTGRFDFGKVLWMMVCVAMWAWLARDQLTIVLCTVFTVPYTRYLFRRSREKEVSGAQTVTAVFGFLSLVELGMCVASLGMASANITDLRSIPQTAMTSGVLAIVFAMAWFATRASAEGLQSLFWIRFGTSLFIGVWALCMSVFYLYMVHDPRTFYQFVFLTAFPTLSLLGYLLFSRRIMIYIEGTAR